MIHLMEEAKVIHTTIDEKGVATVTLNRPDVHNALNSEVIDELTIQLAKLESNRDVRIVVFTGNETAFCSGVDIAWIETLVGGKPSDDARRLAHLLFQIKSLHKPTIAKIDGICMGAGIALASCCDILVATENADFSLPAVHLGIAPTVVTPFIVNAIGAHQAKRYLLTGENFSSTRAREIGLVHAVCIRANLQPTVEEFIQKLFQGGPAAQALCKHMVHDYANKKLDRHMIEDAANQTKLNRKSSEAKLGLKAFIEKHKPDWLKKC